MRSTSIRTTKIVNPPSDTMDPDDIFEERKDLLILAQQKLDEMNRSNLGLRQSSSSRVSRPGSAQGRGGRGPSSPLTTHLLSTLLYVALMSHKLEDMKIMLEHEDADLYSEWNLLFENLHSPEYHSHERMLQNRRVKSAFVRKKHYKELSGSLRKDVNGTSRQLSELQALSNDTNNGLSKAITALQERNSKLDAKCEQLLAELDSVKSKLVGYESDAKVHSQETLALRKEIESKDKLLDHREERISSLQAELSDCEKRSAESRSSAVSAEARRDEAEHSLSELQGKFDAYKLETETQLGSLRKQVHGQNILSQKLASAETALGVANDELSNRKDELAKALASFHDLRAESSSLQKTIETSLSAVNDRLDSSEVLVRGFGESIQNMLRDSSKIGDKVDSASATLIKNTSPIVSDVESIKLAVDGLSTGLLDKSKEERLVLANMEQGLCRLREDLASMEENNHRSHLASKDGLGCIQNTCTAIRKQQEKVAEMVGAASTAGSFVVREGAPSSTGEEAPHAVSEEAPNVNQSFNSAATGSSATDIVDGYISDALALAVKK